MTSFPSVTGKDLLLALKKAGFSLVRVKGNHHFVQHADGRSTVVPNSCWRNYRPGVDKQNTP